MRAFICYPSEFEAVAEALNAELRRRGIDTFYDRKEIKPGDDWQDQIEANIKKAYVFVVLYSPKAANTSKFYLREIKLIQEESERSLKRVIPVIFNPTTIYDNDIPDFFQQRQIIKSETEGEKKEARDGYWIFQIAQELKRLKEILDKLAKRRIISRSILGLGAIIIALLSFNLVITKETLVITKETLEQKILKQETLEEEISKQVGRAHVSDETSGERLCHSLLGKYTLHQNYVFVETDEKDARSTATHATWNAVECVPNKRNGDFILKGEEETKFNIEVIIEGRFEQIATVTYAYGSEVHIRKDGILMGRSFDATIEGKNIKLFDKDARGNRFNKPKSFMDDKVKEMVDLRNEKHIRIKTSPCIPMQGETGGKTAIAFVCPGYIRTMVKDRELPLSHYSYLSVKPLP